MPKSTAFSLNDSLFLYCKLWTCLAYLHLHIALLFIFWIFYFYIVAFLTISLIVKIVYWKKYTLDFVTQSKTNFYSFHLDRWSGVLWRLLLRQNTRDVFYRHSEGVQKAFLGRPFYNVLRTLFGLPQEFDWTWPLALHVGPYGWGAQRDVGRRRLLTLHIGPYRDVGRRRPWNVSRGHFLALHIRPYGDVPWTLHFYVLRTSVGDVDRGHPQDVGRGRLLALHRGQYGDVHRTPFRDVLKTSSRRNFAE